MKRRGNLGKCCLLGIAYGNSAEPEEATLLCRFGSLLSDLLEPTLKSFTIVRGFGVQKRSDRSEFVDSPPRQISWLCGVLDKCLNPIPRNRASVAARKIVHDGLH
jgi:hypothetical protein